MSYAVITLAKVVERLLRSISEAEKEVVHKCFVSLIGATIHLKEVQEEETDGNSGEEVDEEEDEDEEETDYDEVNKASLWMLFIYSIDFLILFQHFTIC